MDRDQAMISTAKLNPQPLIIAHRGGRTGLAENTLAAFEWTIGIGAEMIEFDVRKTRDQVLIVFHDEWLNGKELSSLTYAEVAQQREAPTLEQVLKLTQGKIQLDVELKEIGDEPEALALILNYFQPSEFLISSFNSSSLRRIQSLNPEVSTGFLIEGTRINWELVLTTDPDFLLPEWPLLSSAVRTQSKELNLPLIPWTVNDPDWIREFLQWDEIFGLITDHPEMALISRTVNQEKWLLS